jgi:polyisoprenoid-binding protein YceI
MTVGHSGTGDGSARPGAAARPGGVSARIRTGDGWAVEHAVLTVTDFAGRQVGRAIAGADGEAATGPLPPGPYTAVVTAAGFGPAARTAIVTAGGSAALGIVELDRAGGREPPRAGEWTIDPVHSSLLVAARHLGISSVKGRFTDFGGVVQVAEPVELSSVHAVIQADSIDTGNKVRDDHLRSADFLDAARHPAVEFRGGPLTGTGESTWRLDGRLTLRGVTRPVPLELVYFGTGPDLQGGVRLACRATAELHRHDFGMTFNQVVQAGISAIGTTVRVELDIQAVRGGLR